MKATRVVLRVFGQGG